MANQTIADVYQKSSGLAKYPFEPYWPSKKLRICVTGAGGFIARCAVSTPALPNGPVSTGVPKLRSALVWPNHAHTMPCVMGLGGHAGLLRNAALARL